MSGRLPAEKSLDRWHAVWGLHRQAYSQRAISRILKVGRSTVAHYIRKGVPPRPPRMVATRYEHRASGHIPEASGPIVGRPGPLTADSATRSESAARGGRRSSQARPGAVPVTDLSSWRRKSG